MLDVGARDLRRDTSRILDRVRHGESVTVTLRGKPVALITPIRERQPSGRDDFEPIGFGIWADRADLADVEAWVASIRGERFPR